MWTRIRVPSAKGIEAGTNTKHKLTCWHVKTVRRKNIIFHYENNANA